MKKIFLSALIILSSNILAQQGKPPKYAFSIGPGVVAKTSTRFDNSYDKADKATNYAFIPFMNLKLGPVALRGGGIQVSLPGHSFIRPYVALSRDGERYYGEGMDRRKDSWFAGFGLRAAFLSIEYKKDIQSRSKGSLMRFGLGKRLMLDKLMVRAGVGATYSSAQFNNYYYGVRAHEVTNERSLYKADGSWGYDVNLANIYRLSDKWSTSLIIFHKLLGSVVDDSPTTRKDTETAVIYGLSYKVF